MNSDQTQKPSHDELVRAQRVLAAQIASDMLAGREGVLRGSHRLATLDLELSDDDQRGVLSPFVAIRSETDVNSTSVGFSQGR